MREHLYRGKRKDTGEWVEGAVVKSINGRVYIIFNATEDAINTLNEVDFCYHEVIPETVGEWTGLCDESGKKIKFENDIIKDGQGNHGVIFYSAESCSFLVNWKRKDGSWDTDSCIGYGDVVGNAIDNPELLK